MSTALGYRAGGGPAGIIASAPRQQAPVQAAPLGNAGYMRTTTTSMTAMGGWEARNKGATLTAGFTNSRDLNTGHGSRTDSRTYASRSNSNPATRSRMTKTPTNKGPNQATHNAWDSRYNNWTNGSAQQRASTPGRIRMATAPTHTNHQYAPQVSHIQHPKYQPARTSKVTLVLDLDETLVHSSFDPIPADLHIPLVMDGEQYVAYVNKRPHMERFLAKCVELFDVVVWTASLSVYAEPLINELSRMARCGNLKKMYREHCTEVAGGGYVKDLSALGRSLDDVAILDNSPSVALFQPNNHINIVSWYDDRSDDCLLQLIPFLERLATCRSVYNVIPTLGSSPAKPTSPIQPAHGWSA